MAKNKYRLIEGEHPLLLTGYWRIEKRHWLGYWHEPSVTYAEGATFYDKSEAERWFKYLTGEAKIQETIIQTL